MTESLEDYIRRIQGYSPVFEPGRQTQIEAPQLQAGRVNRILFYPGSFNPPHVGHSALLQHVFKTSASHMNFIAAVVFPLDDEALVERLESDRNPLVLKKHERIRLWRGHGPAAGHVWVYDHPVSSWWQLHDRLIQDVARDGFKLEISVLFGPDNLSQLEEFPAQPWGCNECLFSDIGRDAVITSGHKDSSPGLTPLKQLDLYGPWERTVVGSLCRRDDDPPSTIHFIPKPDDQVVPQTSSSEIRRAIRNSLPGRLEIDLHGLVLNPDVLAEILARRR
ncbi:hypothetical protein ASPZODRAFT_206906 [Penicilliopsis zonata CBS 506.65]|uniref:Cytidyltransferase-like domain-containing protein n=1 Tax=Penicilliopsis zonata CBS 506.65 TaxID=1073090 RepID=A0A1L9STV4_9EURO|nr:hypothetical protein ASPZODRAFT_206906 [Penicilliopsis zonata CBS 506.65]OJJ50551.1 hypothetical protein ASPZODRAFT_206906 [Penicilliopsis zonata CBS 506.65]